MDKAPLRTSDLSYYEEENVPHYATAVLLVIPYSAGDEGAARRGRSLLFLVLSLFTMMKHASMISLRMISRPLVEGFRSLQGSPSELWNCYLLKFLQSYSYYSFSLICVMFLSSDFHYSDMQAGTIYGFWGGLVTFWGFIAGYLIDRIGVSCSLKLGCALTLISRVWVFLTINKTALLFNLCFLLPMGNCLGLPVLATGIRRYTHSNNRSFAFAIFYVVMNLAVLCSGLAFDLCTLIYGAPQKAVIMSSPAIEESNVSSQPIIEATTGTETFYNTDETIVWNFSSFRLLLLTGIIANIISCFVTLGVREIKVELDGRHESRIDGSKINDKEGIMSSLIFSDTETSQQVISPASPQKKLQKVTSFTPTSSSGLQIICETLRASNFWRLVIVCFSTVSVRMIFRHVEATLPKYLEREFGPSTLKGTIYAINPAVVMLMTPLITAFTTDVDPLLMIHYGCFISVLSVFVLAVSTSIPACILFIFMLSIGEATWSPRLYDFTMLISQEGREGTYMALASSPVFLAKLPAGLLSGYLLQTYCPENGPRHSKAMWLIIGLSSTISPILLTICWKFISAYDRGNNNISRTNYSAAADNYNNGKGAISISTLTDLDNGKKYLELPTLS